MIITSGNLAALGTGFSTKFNVAFKQVETTYDKIAMKTTSTGSEETYAWLGQLPNIREWIGSRVIQGLSVYGYTVKNRKFESTVEVARTDIEDDKIGVYGPLFSELGRRTAEHPDELIAELVAAGTRTNCYDGQFFFDTDHPVVQADGSSISVSNYQGPEIVNGKPVLRPTWYMLDLSREVKPFIYQERIPFALTRKMKDDDEHVFSEDAFLYGVRGRSNAGYGLWQLARASNGPLTADNFEAGRAAMASLRGENGKKLGVRCTHVLVPPELEGDARRILKVQNGVGGAGNPWVDAAEMLVSPWL
jgi:phage major head subunit gpT-like protein